MNCEHISLTDLWGNNVADLSKKRLFLFDMDGTIYEEETVFDGTLDLLKLIENIGGRYVFITNNSSKSVADYVKKVNRMGIKGNVENFFTSTQATILYLKNRYPKKRIYCQGTRSFVQELIAAGIDVTEEVEENVDIVLVGFDTELTSEKMKKTCEILQGNKTFIATNPDLRCPMNIGFIPDCGAICNMITAATNKKPIFIGKPEPMMIDCVREKFGCSIDETVVIGDRLYTDILAGINAGVTTICVLTGEATKDEIQSGNINPTFTFQNVRNLWSVLSRI